MYKSKLVLLGLLVIIALALCLVLWIVAIIGAMNVTDGCLYRYNSNHNNTNPTEKVTNTVILKANANYTGSDSGNGVVLDPNSYGQWLNTNLRLKPGQQVVFNIKGEVSLCKSYLPQHNLGGEQNTTPTGLPIEIPRIEDGLATPATLIFDAKVNEWRNIAELFKNDRVIISLHKDKHTDSSSTIVLDSLTQKNISADCRDGQREYHPICGRYSVWSSKSQYVSKCKYVEQCNQCHCRQVCSKWDILGICIGGYKTVCDWCSCYQNVPGTAPEPYNSKGLYTAPWSDNINTLLMNFNRRCDQEQPYIDGQYQNEKYFWFSADQATGLLYRFDHNLNPTDKNNRGDNYSFAKIQVDQSAINNAGNYQIILNKTFTDTDISYLQYRFVGFDNSFADNTGGYVLNIKHTKCRRVNGNSFNDTMEGRGIVQYMIADYGQNPNNSKNGLAGGNIIVNVDGAGNLTTPADSGGYLWLRILNKEQDYKDSFGQYQVQFFTEIHTSKFYHDVLNPFLQGFKTKVQKAARSIFKNMVCYKGTGKDVTASCTDFFSYVKAMLTVYIMLYAMMFLLGLTKISQNDLVMRIVKIAFIAGLINGSTFDFFSNYVFDAVTQFSDEIIANISGYSLFSDSGDFGNPLQFMDAVVSKVLLSPTFAAQIMAMFAMGINGIIYFVIIFVCIGILLIVLFRSIAVYLMAYMAIAVLIGIAPIFLTFILFSRTRYLFDNWVRFTFRYMLEPVILLAGVIIITQLITIYIDYITGYSVCWKCALPIKIPFIGLEGITPAFLNMDIFCINWFAPWGFDHHSSQMGLSMQNLAILLILCYCLWSYLEFAAQITSRLASSTGGPSATSMGSGMSSSAENFGLSKFGLDHKSREIRNNYKKRPESIKKLSDDASSLENRHDIPKASNTNKKNDTQNESGAANQEKK